MHKSYIELGWYIFFKILDTNSLPKAIASKGNFVTLKYLVVCMRQAFQLSYKNLQHSRTYSFSIS